MNLIISELVEMKSSLAKTVIMILQHSLLCSQYEVLFSVSFLFISWNHRPTEYKSRRKSAIQTTKYIMQLANL